MSQAVRDDRLPIDPDVDEAEDARHHRGASLEAPPPLRLHWQVLALVFLGGCVGGVTRYAVVRRWPAGSGGFPWSTFAVNVAGAFVLAVLVVIVVEALREATRLRPLIGTGFCGGLTTFSSVVVSVDRLAAHGHLPTAIIYVVATIGCGLAAAVAGMGVGRLVAMRVTS